MRASRRVVTVVFADLVGFTPLSERLDAEDVAAIQRAYYARARESLVRHGGLVEKFIGDAVVGSFGVLQAGEDDAEHAIRAGLDIVEAVHGLAATFGLEESELQVRVGVNTGEVLITGNGRDWQLTGDVVNVAARLQTAAEPGAVLVGADTALAAEPAIALQPLGPLTVKGKRGPVAAWQVLAPRSTPLRRAASLGGTPATLGREEELSSLLASWAAVGAPPSSWVVIAPPGVGKSRLVAELAARVRAEGGVVWTTRASPDNTGYRCVADLVRQSLGPAAAGPDPVGEIAARLLAHGASELRATVSAEHTRALLAGEELQADPADLFASWTAVLEVHQPTAPVWVVEDLHQAGPDLVEFLRFTVGPAGRSTGLLVMTSRPTATAEELSREGSVRPMQLDPLSEGASVAMIETLLGAGVLTDELVRTVAAQSQGNPLFIEELFRSWVQAGVLQSSADSGWQFAGTAPAERLPTTVQSVYLGQLDGLPEEPRQVIHSGSIPGYTFPSTALPVLEVSDAEAGLRLLTELGLIVGPHEGEADPISYTYRHGLLREVAYASLSRLDRARLHLRFARWVAQSRSGAEAAEAVGRHLAAAHDNLPRLADDLEDGLSREALAAEAGALLESAAESHLTSAPTRAALLLARSLSLCPPEDSALVLRRRLRLGDAQRRAGRLEEAMRSFALAGDLSGRAPVQGSALVTAALGYEDALFASRLPRAEWGATGMSLLEAALAASPADDVRAMVIAAIGRARIYEGVDVDEGRRTCAAAVELAERSGSDAATAYALLASRAGQMSPGRIKERRRTLELAGAAARRGVDAEAELETARLQLADALEDGDVDAADDARIEAEALIERLRRPLYFWYPPMWDAMRSLLDGDTARAAPHVERFREEAARWHYRDALPVHAVQVLELHTQLGDLDPVLPLLRTFTEIDASRWVPILCAALVRSGGHAHSDEAADLMQRMLEVDFEEPRDLAWTYLMAVRAESAAGLGNQEAAAAVTRLLTPWDGHAVVVGAGALCLGAVSHYLGLAARTTGDLTTAADHFRAAVEMNTRMRAAWARARSRAELDRTLALINTEER
jgi:class 3 adenylate cyclase/tetratricopeptide (TPR) repeat protein